MQYDDGNSPRRFDSTLEFWLNWDDEKYAELSPEEKTQMAKNLLKEALNSIEEKDDRWIAKDANWAYEFICEARPITVTKEMESDMKKIALAIDDLNIYHNAMVTFSLLHPTDLVRVPVVLFRAFTKCLYATAVDLFGEDNYEKIKEYYLEWLDFTHDKGGLNKYTVDKYGLASDDYLNKLKKHYHSENDNKDDNTLEM